MFEFRPQHTATEEVVMPQAWYHFPADTIVHVLPCGGKDWFCELSPQHIADPAVVTPQENMKPADIILQLLFTSDAVA